MKKLTLLAITLLIAVSCKKENKDYVSFSGKITNKNSDLLVISNRQGFKKNIKVDENGSFKDTLKLTKGVYSLFDGKEQASIYLKNGDDFMMSLDAKEFDETISFKGKGTDESNFLVKSYLIEEDFFKDENIFKLSKEEFATKTNNYLSNFNTRIKAKELDSAFVTNEKTKIKQFEKYLHSNYEREQIMATKLATGTVSPKFTDYENVNGGTTSLDDLKGKYVYIDVWATWCHPCKQEIPFLKKIEKKFHDKKIEFVSLSIDVKKDNEAWKKMIAEKEMTGVQLFADNNWSSKFVTDYMIQGIPRFILIDPKGNIVNPDAPRPSDPKLVELFESLNI